jgi:chromosome segregation ATPase
VRSEDLAALQEIADRLETRHTSLQELVTHADRSIGQLQRLASLGERVATLEKQLTMVEQLVPKLAEAEAQIAAQQTSQRRLEGNLSQASIEAERIQLQIGDLGQASDAANHLKDELTTFLELRESLTEMQDALGVTRSQVESQHGSLEKLRAEQAEALRTVTSSTERLQAVQGDWQAVTQQLAETEHRVAGIEQLVASLSPVTEGVTQARRQLATAKAAADQLAQRIAGLEQQREAVDRATSRVEHLGAMMRQVDGGMQRQE